MLRLEDLLKTLQHPEISEHFDANGKHKNNGHSVYIGAGVA